MSGAHVPPSMTPESGIGLKPPQGAPLQGPPVPDQDNVSVEPSLSGPRFGSVPPHVAEKEEHRFLQRVALFYGITVLFLLVTTAVWFASDVLLLIFACVLFAVLLYDLSSRLEKRLHISHGLALAMLVVLMFGTVGGGSWLIAPQISAQATELGMAVPLAIEGLRDALQEYDFLGTVLGALPPTGQILSNLGEMLPRAGLLFSGVLGALGNTAIIIFVGIYFAAQPHIYVSGILTLIPHRRRRRTREVLDEIGLTLGQWLVGKMLSMLAVGFTTATGLLLLDVPLALILGILAGLLDFIPYIGPILAGIPAVLIAFSEGPTLALYVVLLLMAVQVAEGYLLLPLVERRTVSLPPAVTILMQVLMGALFGLAGVALATPFAAVLAVLVIMLYVQDVLGDPVKTPAEQSQEDAGNSPGETDRRKNKQRAGPNDT